MTALLWIRSAGLDRATLRGLLAFGALLSLALAGAAAAQEVDQELEALAEEQRELSSRQRQIEERRVELERQRLQGEDGEARAERAEQRFSLGSTLKVDDDEVARDVLALGGGIKVDGEVFGNAVAVAGPIKVEGRITGDVIAVGDNVELGGGAEVLGDVISVGGEVEREEGATVMGEIREVDFIGELPTSFGNWTWWGGGSGVSRFGDFVWNVFWAFFGSAFLLVLALLVRMVAPRQLDRVHASASQDFWMAAFVGLMIQLLTLPLIVAVSVLLLISIIGIPFLVLVPFMVLAFLVAALLGYAGFAQGVGRRLAARFGLRVRGGLFAVLVGVLAIQSVGLLADLLSAAGFPFFITAVLGLIGFVVKFVAWTVGLGAVVLGRFGPSRPTAYLPPLPEGG